MFRLFDIDGDGFISRDDLSKLLALTVGKSITPSAVEDIISRTITAADGDGDGKISYDDFEHVRAGCDNAAVTTGLGASELLQNSFVYGDFCSNFVFPIHLQSTLAIAWDQFTVPVKASSRCVRLTMFVTHRSGSANFLGC